MTRLRYRLYRLASGLRYRIPRRFTPAGLLALVAAIVSGAIGIDMDQTVAFQAFAFVVCLLVVSMGSAIFFRGRFVVRRVLPRFGSVGQSFAYAVQVRKLAGRARRDLELLEELADPRPSLSEFAHFLRQRSRGGSFRMLLTWPPALNQRAATVRPAVLPALTPRGETEARVEVLPLRRGSLRFAAGSQAARHALVSARRRGAGGGHRRVGGIRVAAGLSAWRSAPAHSLAKLGANRAAHREGIPGRVLRPPRADPRHVRSITS
jgi:hypothetical protein